MKHVCTISLQRSDEQINKERVVYCWLLFFSFSESSEKWLRMSVAHNLDAEVRRGSGHIAHEAEVTLQSKGNISCSFVTSLEKQ